VAGPPGAGFGGRKAPNSMGKISTAEVLRLRAPSAVSRDKSVRRSAQDDVFVVSWRCKKPASFRISLVCQNKLALVGRSPGLAGAMESPAETALSLSNGDD
jgi:hypothetical protein